MSTVIEKDEPETLAALLSVQDVAEVLGCSTRHVHRLKDEGSMPPPVRVGALIRWQRATIEKWIERGCPPCRGR
jgi:excisionase family DNA binding protein